MTHTSDATRVLLPWNGKTFRICTINLDQNSAGEKLLKISFPDLIGRQMTYGNETINSCFAPGAFDTFKPKDSSIGCEITYHFLNNDSHFKGEKATYFNRRHVVRCDDDPIEIMYLHINEPARIFSEYHKDPTNKVKLNTFTSQRTLNIVCFPKKPTFFVEPVESETARCLGCFKIVEDEEWKVMLYDYEYKRLIPGQPPIYIQKPTVSTDKTLNRTDDVRSGKLDPKRFSPI